MGDITDIVIWWQQKIASRFKALDSDRFTAKQTFMNFCPEDISTQGKHQLTQINWVFETHLVKWSRFYETVERKMYNLNEAGKSDYWKRREEKKTDGGFRHKLGIWQPKWTYFGLNWGVITIKPIEVRLIHKVFLLSRTKMPLPTRLDWMAGVLFISIKNISPALAVKVTKMLFIVHMKLQIFIWKFIYSKWYNLEVYSDPMIINRALSLHSI